MAMGRIRNKSMKRNFADVNQGIEKADTTGAHLEISQIGSGRIEEANGCKLNCRV